MPWGRSGSRTSPARATTYPNWRVPLADAEGRPVMLGSLPQLDRVNSLVDVVNAALGTHRRTADVKAPVQPERRDQADPFRGAS